jgi:hypothetical protein
VSARSLNAATYTGNLVIRSLHHHHHHHWAGIAYSVQSLDWMMGLTSKGERHCLFSKMSRPCLKSMRPPT